MDGAFLPFLGTSGGKIPTRVIAMAFLGTGWSLQLTSYVKVAAIKNIFKRRGDTCVILPESRLRHE